MGFFWESLGLHTFKTLLTSSESFEITLDARSIVPAMSSMGRMWLEKSKPSNNGSNHTCCCTTKLQPQTISPTRTTTRAAAASMSRAKWMWPQYNCNFMGANSTHANATGSARTGSGLSKNNILPRLKQVALSAISQKQSSHHSKLVKERKEPKG